MTGAGSQDDAISIAFEKGIALDNAALKEIDNQVKWWASRFEAQLNE